MPGYERNSPSTPAIPAAGGTAPAIANSKGNSIPADFDVDGFVRNAKVNFIRLQAANDAGNLEDIREFTTPEMFGEIKLSFAERGQAAQQTDVVTVNAEVLDVTEESTRYIVSVRFTGLDPRGIQRGGGAVRRDLAHGQAARRQPGLDAGRYRAGSVRFRHATKGFRWTPFLLQLCRQKNPRLEGGETGRSRNGYFEGG